MTSSEIGKLSEQLERLQESEGCLGGPDRQADIAFASVFFM